MNNKNVSTSAAHFAWSDTQTRLRRRHPQMTLVKSREDGHVFISSASSELLPYSFGAGHLKLSDCLTWVFISRIQIDYLALTGPNNTAKIALERPFEPSTSRHLAFTRDGEPRITTFWKQRPTPKTIWSWASQSKILLYGHCEAGV